MASTRVVVPDPSPSGMPEREDIPEGDPIPWDVFFWRAPIVRNITRQGATRQEYVRVNDAGSAFFYQPDPNNFWEVEMMELIKQTNAVMYHIPGGTRVWGDGVKLFMPRVWMEDIPEDDLVQAIITGIKVSLAHRERLNY